MVHGVRLSMIMPFTWFVRIPGLATFREANRFTELALVPMVLLAGAAVEWLRTHIKAGLIPILALALLETGWSGNPGIGTMPTALPALDGPIAAQHTKSIVVDLPFGIRGGLPVIGDGFSPETMVLPTADGHPLGDALISRIPASTLTGIERRPFYAALLRAQGGHIQTTATEFTQARANARQMNIGWVLVWRRQPAVLRVLRLTGFRRVYEADGVLVYRPAHDVRASRDPAAGRTAVRSAAGLARGRTVAAAVRPPPGGGMSATRPSAARPRIRPRSPEASPARSSTVSAARIRACRVCHALQTRAATRLPSGVR